MSEQQRTISRERSLTGIGLHTGHPVTLTLKPAGIGEGIRFRRIDLGPDAEIPALVDHVVEIARATVLGRGDARVHTVEHVLAAALASGVDNLTVELTADEPPAMDGSAQPFMELLRDAGIVEQEAPREYVELEQTLTYHSDRDGIDIVVVPSAEFRATYMIDYVHASIGNQYTSMYTLEEFGREFASARTFCLLSETEALKAQGLILGGSLENAVVFVDREYSQGDLDQLKRMFRLPEGTKLGTRTLDDRPLRFPNEPVRHKVLDLVGDLALVGAPIKGHVLAAKGGHASHVEVAKLLRKILESQRIARKFGGKTGAGYVFDSVAIQALLPHKYPMLLVDRILELTPLERVVGLKNVTRNEPFFDGHFPGHPVMPGVLIVEAMGQTGGVLLLNSVEHPETKVVYFTGLDNVKFRKTVVPGDQIKFTVTMSMFRRNLCKMRGEAHVDGVLAAEADMTALIVEK
ncbi:bifunctional UDP-3-O-[3-hydroxymyristoyl] N-acetylglucosamine deacetylase/3-hydroxyacyl-ACP dehydratase [candidate division KSB1 bacterium]|nr:bifunctional UDP-3-O-[3-hydroxymyristoyl] N-acetylglucosamine deacetylase/3-hydroxyacyl-ACP dehydratase [candidate division KSB1 bacterium]